MTSLDQESPNSNPDQLTMAELEAIEIFDSMIINIMDYSREGLSFPMPNPEFEEMLKSEGITDQNIENAIKYMAETIEKEEVQNTEAIKNIMQVAITYLNARKTNTPQEEIDTILLEVAQKIEKSARSFLLSIEDPSQQENIEPKALTPTLESLLQKSSCPEWLEKMYKEKTEENGQLKSKLDIRSFEAIGTLLRLWYPTTKEEKIEIIKNFTQLETPISRIKEWAKTVTEEQIEFFETVIYNQCDSLFYLIEGITAMKSPQSTINEMGQIIITLRDELESMLELLSETKKSTLLPTLRAIVKEGPDRSFELLLTSHPTLIWPKTVTHNERLENVSCTNPNLWYSRIPFAKEMNEEGETLRFLQYTLS